MPIAMDLTMDELRCERRSARRDLERARMRTRGQRGAPADDAIDAMSERVRVLTDELIARYAADLSQVDTLLVSAARAVATPERWSRTGVPA